MNNEHQAGFRDPALLTRWTRVFLYASLAVSLVNMSTSAFEMAGGSDEGSLAGLLASGVVWAIVSLTVWLGTAVLVLSWIYRANYNARELGASDMEFTPGWAVGWYFVPIAWFWKPYQAMRETWKASANPSDWRGQPVASMLHWWWILWIVPFWGGWIVDWVLGRNLDEAGAETVEAATGLVGTILDIPLTLVLLAIIGAVHRMQVAHHLRQGEDAT